MDSQRSSLLVSLQNVEFAKPYHYFITVQIEGSGEKRRTDISANVTNPVFSAPVFVLPLAGFKIDVNDRLILQAFIVTDRDDSKVQDLETKGQAKLLGESIIELGPLTAPLTDISGLGVRQNLKFVRKSGEKEVTVGRFVVQLKLVGEQTIPIEGVANNLIEGEDYFHPLPVADPFMDFVWRLRVDVRYGVDMPMTEETNPSLPSCFVELGWTLYENQPPDDSTLNLTSIIENNRHPNWNQQFLIVNPQTVLSLDGFLYFNVRNRKSPSSIETFYIPIKPMQPFIPYNLEIILKKREVDSDTRIYISITLEMLNQNSFVDALTDIALHFVHLDPFPLAKNFFVLMTLHNHKPTTVPFMSVDLNKPKNFAKIIQENSVEKVSTFISPMLKVPPRQSENLYRAVATFTLPKTALDKNVSFFIAGRDDTFGAVHGMPNAIVGFSDICDDLLKDLYYSKDKSQVGYWPISWANTSKIFPAWSRTKCNLELGVFGMEDLRMELNKRKSTVIGNREFGESANDKLASFIGKDISSIKNEKEKWDVLSKELAQKQEIIHRMLKEIDDKTESLKLTGSEIVDLRRQIKLLQSENAILRKRLAHEEQLEVTSIVSKEIAKMTVEELKAKIIKIAQAYRDERIRNEEFEKALKTAQRDITQTRTLSVEIEGLQKQHQINARKLLSMQQEIQKTQLYKETIKKQEKVIDKLEKMMETTLKDTEKARSSLLELEQIKSENINLQKQLKQMAFGTDGEYSDIQKYKSECSRLEKLVMELREELKSKRPVTSYGSDLEKEKWELEVRLEKACARVEALQNEMTDNARNFAKEIANLKMIIAEKQALLDTLSVDI